VPVMAVYVVVSNSLVSMCLLILAISCYTFLDRRLMKGTGIKMICMIILAIPLLFGYLYYYGGSDMIQNKFKVSQENGAGSIKMPGLQNRLVLWEFYGKGVTKDTLSFLMGNTRLPDRSQYPSAHNYYLDFLYYFGFFPLIPLLVLIGGTLYGVYRNRKEIIATRELLGLTIVVLFLLLVDNMLKVGLRQPYPGIFTFFLWGILISKLSVFSSKQVTAG
jgi:hypothetical protein